MADLKRFIFAKFKRSDRLDMMASFLISADREKVRAWTGNKEDVTPAPADVVEPNKPSTAKATGGFESLTEEFLKAIEVFYRLGSEHGVDLRADPRSWDS